MKKCILKGCDKQVLARGWCSAHYAKWRQYGHPLSGKLDQLHGATLLERWQHYTPEKGAGCWEWGGYRDPNGYGRLNVGNKPILAHRIAWELFRDEIAPEDHICHRCDNPACVRPEHLFKGDHTLNMADKMAKKRHRYGVSRGANHGCAKLSERDVRAIRNDTRKLREIAAEYGISTTQVSDIRNRRSWRHIE